MTSQPVQPTWMHPVRKRSTWSIPAWVGKCSYARPHTSAIVRLLAYGFVAMAICLGCNAVADTPDQAASQTSPDAHQCKLILEFPAKGGSKIQIKNVGKQAVTLVTPGDGSAVHWRTPIVSWSFLPVDSKAKHPKDPPRPRRAMRCGNINPLRPQEVFVLEPGATRDISKWFSCLTPPDAFGKYRVVCYYSNVPNIKWSGLPLGKHDEKAMEAVRNSTPLALVSNEALFEFQE